MRFRFLLLFLLLVPWLLTTVSCNLVRLQDDGEFPRSEIEPVDTQGWVAFPGRGVSMGAPSASWEQVPTNLAASRQRVQALEATDPSVAPVFLSLALLANDSFYQLVLIRNDGTAYATITTRSLRPGQTQDAAVEEARQELLANGIVPRQQRSLIMPEGDAIRWTIDVTPEGSRAINRQFQYLLVINSQLYTFTFSAQLPDFDDYTPIFETMALTFRLAP